MPMQTRDILQLTTFLAEEKNIRVTVKESVKGGLMAGMSTIIGGILMGPAGLAIGGALGGCTAAYLSQGKFKPLAQVLAELHPSQQALLAMSVNNVLQNITWEDYAMLLALVTGNPSLKAQVLRTVYSFVQGHLQMQVLD